MGGTPLSPHSLIPRRARFELEHLAAKERRGKRYEGERFARAAVIFRRFRFLHERKDEGWRGRYTINGDGENLSLFIPIQCQARSVLDDGIITFRCVIGTLEVRVSPSSLSRTPPPSPAFPLSQNPRVSLEYRGASAGVRAEAPTFPNNDRRRPHPADIVFHLLAFVKTPLKGCKWGI